MRVLLTGADGQLGRHLAPLLAERFELVTSAPDSGDRPCDLREETALRGLLDEVSPNLIVNPAAWTAVDDAEDHEAAAARLNQWLPARLAAWCRSRDAGLVHFSTDYVFSGRPDRAWLESDPPAPASAYGRTKLAGEDEIRRSGAGALILRTAWLYSALPGNFLSAILARAARGEDLRVVSDQFGSPTWAGSLARMTLGLLGAINIKSGSTLTLHAVDRGRMSWHEFAAMAVDMACERGLIERPVAVAAIASDEWPQRAERPRWSVLDAGALEARLGRSVPTVRQALSACLDEWKPESC